MDAEEYLKSLEPKTVEETEGQDPPEGEQNQDPPEGQDPPENQDESQNQDELKDEELPVEKQLQVASKLLGKEFVSLEEIEAFKAQLDTPVASKSNEVVGKLLEKLKAAQNIMSYFPDESAYKAAQLSKQEEYKGKESIINKVLSSDVSQLPSLEAIELQARLDAPKGIRNPFRAKLANLGFSPDLTQADYDELSEDDKDRIDLLASESRKSLSKLGQGIEIPKTDDSDIVSEIEAEISRSKEDLAAKRNSLAPIAEALVSDLKEIEIAEGFNFKLDLTKEDKAELNDFITNAVLSGDYDLSTDKGKAEMWEAVKDLVFLNNKARILPLLTKHIRDDEQRKARQKSNNAAPINKQEPAPAPTTTSTMSPWASLAKEMVDERK